MRDAHVDDHRLYVSDVLGGSAHRPPHGMQPSAADATDASSVSTSQPVATIVYESDDPSPPAITHGSLDATPRPAIAPAFPT